MTIKITTNKGTQELNLNNISISITSLKIGEDILFKDIIEISFNENDFVMQMVEGIRDCCTLSYEEFGNKIKLTTYN